MKSLISILLLFCSFVSYSQTSFSDTLHYSVPGYYYENLILNSDLTFKFETGSCTGEEKGKGIYSITNDTLTIKFINEDTINNSRYFVNDCKCKDTSKLKVKIIVRDNNLNKRIFLGTNLVMSNKKKSYDFTSDKNDNYLISISNKEYYHFQIFPNSRHLKLYKDFDFYMMVDNCKEVIVYLDWIKNSGIKNKTIWKYIINNKKINNKKLSEGRSLLTNKNGNLILARINNY